MCEIKEIAGLTEKLAENVHEIWMAGRIAEGWTYGEHIDEAAKKTPLLVPYSQLPESEKEYDRRTALGTLKMIQESGFKIVRK